MNPNSGRLAPLLTFLALMIAVLVVFFRMMAPYLMALLMGGILAILSNPGYLWMMRKGIRPSRASAWVVLGVTVLVLVPLSLFVIAAVRQTILLAGTFSNYELLTMQGITDRVLQFELLQQMLGSPAEVQERLRGAATTAVQATSRVVLAFASQIPELFLQMILALFATYFLLIDGPALLAWVSERLPIPRNLRQILTQSFRNTAISVIVATVAAAGAQFLLMFLGFLVLGVPAAFLAAGATFIFAWVPMVGSLPVWVAGAIYLYFQGTLVKVVLMVIVGAVAGVADNIVRPLVLQGRSEMHPLVSLVAIFGGIAMWGIPGVFVGPILTAVVYSVVDTWPAVARQYGIIVGDNVAEVAGLTRGATPESRPPAGPA